MNKRELLKLFSPSRGNEEWRQEIFASYSSRTIPAPPLVAGATTFAPVGSVSLDSQSPKGSLRIQFPCHPASRWDYGCWAFRAICMWSSSGGKPYNRASPVGNAPLLPPAAASPPEGEILAALCLVILMKLNGKQRANFPLRGAQRTHFEGATATRKM